MENGQNLPVNQSMYCTNVLTLRNKILIEILTLTYRYGPFIMKWKHKIKMGAMEAGGSLC